MPTDIEPVTGGAPAGDHSTTDPGAVVATLAQSLLDDHLETMVIELLGVVVAAEAVYDESDLRAQLETSIRDNMRSVLVDLARQRGPELTFPQRTARARADQGVPLESVLHAYGLAFRTIWSHMVDLAIERGGDQLHQLLRGGAAVWDEIDAYSSAVAVEYRHRLGQLARREERQRQAMVGALVDGRVTDWELRTSVAKVVGLPTDAPCLVVSAELPGEALSEDEPLPDVEQHLARHGVASGWSSHADGLVGVVALAPDVDADRVVALLGEVATGRVGVSQVVASLGEAPEGLPIATIARATLAPGHRGVARLSGRPTAALVAAAPVDLARRVAREVLGGIDELADDERDVLIETLQAWFDHGGSTTATAAALFCHRNTVRNRLNRIGEVTGHDVLDPRDVSALHAGLHARRLVSDRTA